ncbi:MAG TPA: DNA adenine methylase [Candidatus Acidoferrales bacterium]|nr:DNA adenine methylase [Candidatus Acidoferrales bacterium]
MKYMGSKRSMLANGLGQILRAEAANSKRFADLFVGSGAVAWYIAENTGSRVLAVDLQLFAVSLAEAVINRDKTVDAESVWKGWFREAQEKISRSRFFQEAEEFDKQKWGRAPREHVDRAREFSARSRRPITRAYGGHYFSPKQALIFDALRSSLPDDGPMRSVALAALICAASECAAAPGHTAQPFQPTRKAAQFLFGAWREDVCSHVKSALDRICPKCARTKGRGMVCDAEAAVEQLRKGDVAFLDPPYSGVHYSRFYHVLETVARGTRSEIEGAGRYPPPSERPRSDFSLRSKSEIALERLLSKLAEKGVRAILTFPQEETSNGLSGSVVEKIAKNYFKSSKVVVNGRFSTLGGNSENRKARIPAYEVILTLTPPR